MAEQEGNDKQFITTLFFQHNRRVDLMVRDEEAEFNALVNLGNQITTFKNQISDLQKELEECKIQVKKQEELIEKTKCFLKRPAHKIKNRSQLEEFLKKGEEKLSRDYAGIELIEKKLSSMTEAVCRKERDFTERSHRLVEQLYQARTPDLDEQPFIGMFPRF